MTRKAIFAICVIAFLPACARQDDMHMEHMDSMMGGGMMMGGPTEPGQGAFAAIHEIVRILESDPQTDWSKVDIEALRQHLIDMDAVTLRASVTSEAIPNGARFTVTGTGGDAARVTAAIQRMTSAHATAMSMKDMAMGDAAKWRITATNIADGAIVEVVGQNEADAAKIRGLGFIGIMALGNHHQRHHLMMAKGMAMH